MKTKLHYYSFDWKGTEERIQLRNRLKKEGYVRMGANAFPSFKTEDGQRIYVDKLDGVELELDTKFLFNNQWNTVDGCITKNGIRVFDWYEVESQSRVCGYWLDMTEEMLAERRKRYICGYCGAQYILSHGRYTLVPTDKHIDEPGAIISDRGEAWCQLRHCLGGEHLELDNVYLTHLRNVCNVHPSVFDIPDKRKELYFVIQKEENTKRQKIYHERKLANLREKVEQAQKEYAAIQWLIDNNLPCDNVIYYAHQDVFVFGWRKCYTDDKQRDLEQRGLTQFPYKWIWAKKES